MNVILQWYGVVTAIFFGISAMLVQDEVKARTDFELERGRGTYNVFKYYQHLKINNEKFSLKFKFFLLAHLNLIAFVTFLFVGFR